MSYMFEVCYKAPADLNKESALTQRVAVMGGRLDFREETNGKMDSVCLTYEFDNYDSALKAANALREQGEHVEGPADYGD